MEQPQLLLSTKNNFLDLQAQVNQQIKNHCHQLKLIDQSNEKVIEKLLKQQEKLQMLVSKLDYYQIQPQVSYLDLILKHQYKYELKLSEDLELPCYRNRIFSIRFNLMYQDQICINQNKIIVELEIWTYDELPKKVSHNNQGESIYKGCQQAFIKEGQGRLNKIQIKEVSSHFPRGQFVLIIVPVNDHGVIGNQKLGEIKKEWIKPLVLNEFVVKAKRFSNRHVPYYIRKDGTVNMKPI
ncbi:unnamed protein product (macronuclear) [Paramecium tetraurelia]|uniref:Uncharacterized protein n=1 Tax=Paramecium tetraurelia TaxID=5888 RepID=A0BZK4_PARTE|nr:uncharacterized protein GSPATT00033824001 [Paramecium tetraurelia]CAK63971.1 unnamed protein product [Paramecium tetraurelia]|eukprot:XP_001431369.1 hypothetical protein (macronuclear) [Paramecium tetraurelia strain d4-2]